MKITIITDNVFHKRGLVGEWGFAALIEAPGAPGILFDTGASGEALSFNMKKLNIDPQSVGCVFISHDHWDHQGGLDAFLAENRDVKLFLPAVYSSKPDAAQVIPIPRATTLFPGVHSTGTLGDIEQSLCVETPGGVVVIAGCSHPGVGLILETASRFGKPEALIGGLHGFNDYELLEGLDLVCATHCTQNKDEIKKRFPEKFVQGGSGAELEL